MTRLVSLCFRTRVVLVVCLFSLAAIFVGASAGADHGYVFPSTNADNALAGHPHVLEVSTGPGQVTLEFVNETNSLAFFEYRIDGEGPTSGEPHPVVHGDVIHPGVCVDGRAGGPILGCTAGSVVMTFSAAEQVEVRLALGGERDWDFDWTSFPAGPITKESCKKGGWADLGFPNQGACIKATK